MRVYRVTSWGFVPFESVRHHLEKIGAQPKQVEGTEKWPVFTALLTDSQVVNLSEIWEVMIRNAVGEERAIYVDTPNKRFSVR